MNEQFDSTKVREVEVRSRDADGKLLMVVNFKVDQSAPFTLDIETEIDDDYWFKGAARAFLPKPRKRWLKMRGPFKKAEIRVGAAVSDLVLCRWDESSKSYAPEFTAMSNV